MKKLLVSDVTNKIYLVNAKPVKGHPHLVEAVGEKQDYTDEAIGAVYQWFLNHCRKEKSGLYQVRFPNKPWLTMNLNETGEAMQAGEETK